MTLAGTLELIARGRARAAGRDLQLPQSDPSLRCRSLPRATPRASGIAGLLLTDLPAGSDPGRRARRAAERARSDPADRADHPRRRGWPPRWTAPRGSSTWSPGSGVTGASRALAADLAESVARVRAGHPAPRRGRIRHLDARSRRRSVGRLADGVVVGSALVDALGRDGVAGARRFLRELRAGPRSRPGGGVGMSMDVEHAARALRPAADDWRPGRHRRGALAVDQRWLQQPIAVILLTVMVLILRAVPVRLSKYSYLTQTGIPVLVGAVTVGPSPVVLALYLGVLGADVVWLRKLPRAGLINAGREVLGFIAAFGPYAAVHYFARRTDALAGLPAGRGHPGRAVLLLHPRALLLHPAGAGQAGVRGEDPDPALGDHLLPAHAHRRRSWLSPALQTLAPVGWVAVALPWACSGC